MRSITDYLMEARRGEFVALASEDFADLIRRIDMTGKKGSMTITISIEPDKLGGREKKVTFTHAAKMPNRSARPAVFFSNEDGDLIRDDPDQRPLFGQIDDPRMAQN